MNANRKALIEALEVVVPVLGSAGTPVELQSIRIWDDQIQTTNGLVRIQTNLPTNLGLRISVPGAAFVALLKSLKTDDVDLNIDKGGKYLAVRTTKVEGKFNITKIDKFDPIEFAGYKSITNDDLCSAIMSGMTTCRNNVSKDENAGALQGVRVEGNEILSTNRSRIYRFTLPADTGWHCTIYKVFIDVADKHRDHLTSFHLNDDSFGVIAGGVIIQTKLISGAYPALDQYFPNRESVDAAKCITYLDPMGDSLSRHIDFLAGVDSAEKEVSISFSGTTCEIVSRNPSIGEITEVIDLKEAVPDHIEFLINPILLKDFLTRCNHFKYLPDSKLVLFEIHGVEHLIQTRE